MWFLQVVYISPLEGVLFGLDKSVEFLYFVNNGFCIAPSFICFYWFVMVSCRVPEPM